jgi:hypothetical protein
MAAPVHVACQGRQEKEFAVSVGESLPPGDITRPSVTALPDVDVIRLATRAVALVQITSCRRGPRSCSCCQGRDRLGLRCAADHQVGLAMPEPHAFEPGAAIEHAIAARSARSPSARTHVPFSQERPNWMQLRGQHPLLHSCRRGARSVSHTRFDLHWAASMHRTRAGLAAIVRAESGEAPVAAALQVVRTGRSSSRAQAPLQACVPPGQTGPEAGASVLALSPSRPGVAPAPLPPAPPIPMFPSLTPVLGVLPCG